MVDCLNPHCSEPENPDNADDCHNCGTSLHNPYPFYKDRYRILQVLGCGGFGRTYLVKDTKNHDRPCVLKMLLSQATAEDTERAIRKFKLESEKLATLNHPQIPQQYKSFQDRDSFFIVQQFIEGEHLLKECLRQGCFSERKVVELLQGLLPILKEIHDLGLVHRDIKPVNIMRRSNLNMAEALRLVLIDFGILKDLSTTRKSSVVYGTRGYAAIEHMMGNPEPASDIYSLGATSIYLLTGCFPDVLGKNIEFDRNELRFLWREELQRQGRTISDELAYILDKMLRPWVTQRYQSAAEVMEAIAKLSPTPQPQQPTPLPRSADPESSVEPTRHWMSLIKTWVVSPKAPEVGIPVMPVNPNPGQPLKTFSFEVITADNQGKVKNRRPGQANYLIEEIARGVGLEMVAIPGGSFMMGSPETEEKRDSDESPQHQVTIQPFYMGKYAITQAQWKAVAALPKIKIDLKPDPSNFKGANRPVETVSWWEAEEFCKRLSKKTGKQYRLPSEAEWEYACRAGTTTPFHFGETITSELVNYDGNYAYGNAPKGKYREQTVEVGTLPPNGYGLYEMHGNVWEWCADHWHENYQGAPNNETTWLTSDERNTRLLRGGSWSSISRFCRSAHRGRNYPGHSNLNIGFRAALSPRTP
ncbi:bifunctional serine/threonine-protein kinase/formylglycine-generating enzyme family protein [Oscillatoria sp. FACHB-1406]|uniref:bifunctional serine/threonine-protein kinase/formylglycine-generating enzyme family protein n=1 Tax=Oscillatoria sp. FACHB-1406 TaxID=2692846 RepID=UPI00168262CD|nr:bifunctional serine/threonine-protein kinase/formylglycine-generating enzyme family protein [Oscillatoria sp. FACHB-1406]MBD2576239.1 SUMF1/EgtB/PvdO family nonheme iron enzyme [Oscillatoria sp. FACHB-1406]